ncbi:MAG: hypothetical protein ACUVR8_05825 [Acidobacteriota bacterium]
MQPYAAAFLVTRNSTGKYISEVQLKWLLFDLETRYLLEEGRARASRLPIGVVKALKEQSRLEDFISLLGKRSYGLPLEPFQKKHPGKSLRLVFIIEQAQFLNGETWSRESIPTRYSEPENSGYCPNQVCETVRGADGDVLGFRCDDFNGRGLRCENHGVYCAVYPCEALQPQGMPPALCDDGGQAAWCEDWWAIFPQ